MSDVEHSNPADVRSEDEDRLNEYVEKHKTPRDEPRTVSPQKQS